MINNNIFCIFQCNFFLCTYNIAQQKEKQQGQFTTINLTSSKQAIQFPIDVIYYDVTFNLMFLKIYIVFLTFHLYDIHKRIILVLMN